MSRTWEENRVEGGLSGLDDDDFDDSGTVDLGSGTTGGQYNVTDDGHTVSDEEVRANPDQYQVTGNDTVQTTNQPTSNQPETDQQGDDSVLSALGGDNQTLLLVGAAAAVAVARGVSN